MCSTRNFAGFCSTAIGLESRVWNGNDSPFTWHWLCVLTRRYSVQIHLIVCSYGHATFLLSLWHWNVLFPDMYMRTRGWAESIPYYRTAVASLDFTVQRHNTVGIKILASAWPDPLSFMTWQSTNQDNPGMYLISRLYFAYYHLNRNGYLDESVTHALRALEMPALDLSTTALVHRPSVSFACVV